MQAQLPSLPWLWCAAVFPAPRCAPAPTRAALLRLARVSPTPTPPHTLADDRRSRCDQGRLQEASAEVVRLVAAASGASRSAVLALLAAVPRPAPVDPPHPPHQRQRPTRHPDKNPDNQDTTTRFQQVSAAYARLTGADESDDDLDDVSRGSKWGALRLGLGDGVGRRGLTL